MIPTEDEGKILALLEAIARYVYNRLGAKDPKNVRVRKLQVVTRVVGNCVGIHLLHKKRRVIYVGLDNINTGKRYTWRFILSILAHELAHDVYDNHDKSFKARQRRCSTLIREFLK